jgi:hypothetical protein
MSEEYTPVINKEELAPGVVLYKDVIPGHHQLVPYIEQIAYAGMAEWKVEEFQGNQVETMLFDYPSQFKDPNDFSVTFEERISLVTAGFLGVIENDYVTTNKLPQKAHDKLALVKYPTGSTFPLSETNDDMALTIMYYLNEDFAGGEIEFPKLGIKYQPKENQAIIFPQAEGFEYSVSTLTEGIKYAIITYIRNGVKNG